MNEFQNGGKFYPFLQQVYEKLHEATIHTQSWSRSAAVIIIKHEFQVVITIRCSSIF